jgi:hypothetical protein
MKPIVMSSIAIKVRGLIQGSVVSQTLARLDSEEGHGPQLKTCVDYFVLAHRHLEKGQHLNALSLNLKAWSLADTFEKTFTAKQEGTSQSCVNLVGQNRLFVEGVIMLGQILWFWRIGLAPQLRDPQNEVWQMACELFFQLGTNFDMTKCQDANLKNQWIGLSEGLHPNYWLPLGSNAIQLRRLGLADQKPLMSLLQEPQFIDQYLPSLQANERYVEQWCGVAQTARSPMKRIEFAVVQSNCDELLGLASLGNIDWEGRNAEFLVGINVHARSMGLGAVGLQASVLLMTWAFRVLNLKKLISFVYDKNRAAQSGTLRLGFVQEDFLNNQIKNTQTGELASIFKNGLTKHQFENNPQLQRWVQRFSR